MIRTATYDDYDAMVRLYDEFGGTVPAIGGPRGRTRWREIIDHPGTTVFVFDQGGRPVATAVLHILPNMTYEGRPYALIENVITAKAHRRGGLGRRVMQATIDAAWAADAYKIMLLTGRNRPGRGALGFYESLGFTADEKHALTLRRIPPRRV